VNPLPSFSPSLPVRVLRRLRHALYGYRAGLGNPVPAAALDREYASGAWDHFFGPAELPRFQALLGLIAEQPSRPRLLELGCGSGRLASLLDPAHLADYLGADISAAGLLRPRALGLPPPLDRFAQHEVEVWTPAPGACDLVCFTACLGYAPDPLRTARRFAAALAPGGLLLVSHFRSGNHAQFWRRLARGFDFPAERVAANPAGQTWDLRSLRLRA